MSKSNFITWSQPLSSLLQKHTHPAKCISFFLATSKDKFLMMIYLISVTVFTAESVLPSNCVTFFSKPNAAFPSHQISYQVLVSYNVFQNIPVHVSLTSMPFYMRSDHLCFGPTLCLIEASIPTIDWNYLLVQLSPTKQSMTFLRAGTLLWLWLCICRIQYNLWHVGYTQSALINSF